jgi:hypothetical protein
LAHKSGCKFGIRLDDGPEVQPPHLARGEFMKKIALLLVAAAFAATPAVAAKKKEPKMTPEEAQRDASWRLVKNGLPLILPTWAMPFYFHMKDDEAKKEKKEKKM